MRQWNPIPSNSRMLTTNTGESFELLLSWEYGVPGGLFTHQCSQYAGLNDAEVGQTLPLLKARCISHAMVDVLPDRAIKELVETLKEMLSFYNTEPFPISNALPPKEIQAKVGETYLRPSFQIAEE